MSDDLGASGPTTSRVSDLSAVRGERNGDQRRAVSMKTRPSGAVLKAVDVLRLFQQRSTITPGDCAASLGMPLSTAHRQLATLRVAGLLESDGDGVYRLGLSLFELGCRVSKPAELAAAGHRSVNALVRRTGMVAHLALADDTDFLYVVRRSRSPNPAPVRVGMRGPYHATALGKAILATWPEVDVVAALTGNMVKFTEHTTIDVDRLLAELRDVGESGVARERDERRMGQRALAAAIRPGGGAAAGAISVSYTGDMPSTRLKHVRSELREAASGIARVLDHQALVGRRHPTSSSRATKRERA